MYPNFEVHILTFQFDLFTHTFTVANLLFDIMHLQVFGNRRRPETADREKEKRSCYANYTNA